MDYFLQGENGGSLCKLLKETAETAQLPVLLYSAYPNTEKSLDHFGCDAFLAKIFSITELTEQVTALLHQAVRREYQIRWISYITYCFWVFDYLTIALLRLAIRNANANYSVLSFAGS